MAEWRKSSYSGATNECVEVRLTWHKSSYSNEKGGNCVEVLPVWHKASYSNASGGECVEVTELPYSALMRDTQNRRLGHLGFPSDEWTSFLLDVKADRL